MVIVLMGPAGAGKSTTGSVLAERLGWRFVEGDEYHAGASVAKMTAGVPLTDADRAGWLRALRQAIVDSLERREQVVLACSALTRAHRQALASGLRGVRFVYLKVGRDLLRERLHARRDHFAKASLLDSQLATLEEPCADEALIVDGAADIDTIVGHIRLELGV